VKDVCTCSTSTFLNAVMFCYWLLLVQIKSQLKGFRVAWKNQNWKWLTII